MTIGINTSPLAGQEGTSLTARLVKDRLDAELVGNVSIEVLPTERPDTWEVQGRGELQLAVLVEMMRREGFELTVGKPQVLTKEIDGKVHEPVDRLTVDVPEDFLGVVTQLLALRKGRMEQIVNHGTGWVRIDYLVPARGLIGFRTEFLTETRGTGLLHHVFERFEPWAGEIRARARGSLVADRLGPTTGYSLMSLQERGQLFVGARRGRLRGDDRRRERPGRRHGRQPDEGEEAHQHAVQRRLVREADPAAADVARAGAGVHRRRRVRRGHAAVGAAAQDDPRPDRARSGRQAGQGRRLGLRPAVRMVAHAATLVLLLVVAACSGGDDDDGRRDLGGPAAVVGDGVDRRRRVDGATHDGGAGRREHQPAARVARGSSACSTPPCHRTGRWGWRRRSRSSLPGTPRSRA